MSYSTAVQSAIMARVNPFLQLPLEVKNEIYQYLLTGDEYRINPQQNGTSPATNPQLYPQILATNKQINREATDILYDRNPWIVITISHAGALTAKDLPFPRLEVPGQIRKRLQSPSKTPGLILPVRIEDADLDLEWALEGDPPRRSISEFMLDFRNFSRLCRFSLDNFFLMDRTVTVAFDYTNADVERIARFYSKVMGCLGEADGQDSTHQKPYMMTKAAREDEKSWTGSSDFALGPRGYYTNPETLLRRMDHYEEKACRFEQSGDLQAAQCLRFDCLELAEYGGWLWYMDRDTKADSATEYEMKRILNRIMSTAILCATSSLEIGNTEMIACVQTKVKFMTEGERYARGDFEFQPTDDYRIIMEQCSWRMLRDQHVKGPVAIQELQQMTEHRRWLPDGGDPWSTFDPAGREVLIRLFWPDAGDRPQSPLTFPPCVVRFSPSALRSIFDGPG